MRKPLTLLGALWLGCSSEPPAVVLDGSTSSSESSSSTTSSTSSGTGEVTSGTTTATDASSPETAIDGTTSESGGSPSFDLGGGIADLSDPPCTRPSPPTDLWLTNRDAGTVSRLDTIALAEAGRYVTRPDGMGMPTMVSVAMSGNVAAGNSFGGVTKIYADTASCVESNGMAGIQSSDGAGELPWGEEECVAWHTPFDYEMQWPVAWVRSEFDPIACAYPDERLWVAGRGENGVEVSLLDGETGAVVDQVLIPELFGGGYFGLFSGAVDSEGDFWAGGLGSDYPSLVRVDFDDLEVYDVWTPPSGQHWYDLTIDDQNQPWICGHEAARFDLATETFVRTPLGDDVGGCMAAAGDDGLLWISVGTNLYGIDRTSQEVEVTWPIPGYISSGISVDYDGNIWALEAYSTAVHRIDPDDGDIVTIDDLPMRNESSRGDAMGYALRNLP